MTSLLQRTSLVLGGLLPVACGDSEPMTPIMGSPNPIRFSQLEVGQTSVYGVFVFSPPDSSFEYVDGLLVAELIDRDATGFRVRESFSSSAEVDDRISDLVNPDRVYEYYLSVDDDVLRVLPAGTDLQARLFPHWYGGPVELKLADVTSPVVQLDGWKTTLPDGSEPAQAAIINGRIQGATYEHLNVLVDNSAIPADGPGLLRLYSAEHGLVRSAVAALLLPRGVGHDRTPKIVGTLPTGMSPPF